MSSRAAGEIKAPVPGRSHPDSRDLEGPASVAEGPTVASQPLNELETILYHITHDLRAAVRPMAIVPGWVREDLAREGHGVPETLEQHLQTMEEHAGRLDRMLLDLRTYSRIGRVSDPPTRVILDEGLDAVLVALSLPVEFEVIRHFQTDTVIAPRNEFRLLLQCLVENAWKHHDRDRGRITIAACLSGDAARITVIDDGPGIERRYRGAAFRMMSTLRPRDEVEGSGMGLSIARKIVTRLGGTIEIAEPLAPRGTCVVVVLPQPRTAVSDRPDTPAAPGPGGAGNDAP